jgi:transaldolase
MQPSQIENILESFSNQTSGFISIFAGRIADTGRDPLPFVKDSLKLMTGYPQLSLIWASPRELLNIFQADELGCHIITATSDILNKLHLLDYDLETYSLDTVKMFLNDARISGYEI